MNIAAEGGSVSGTVTANQGGAPWSVSQAGLWAVSVSNFPATQPVSGTIAVSNFPATQPVSGMISVSNFPATQPVSGTIAVSNFPATQPVSGMISVSNFPATQPVSGTVSVFNFPATQVVSGTVTANQGGAPWTATGTKTPTDSFTNPTDAIDSMGLTMLYNGTNWDRARSDATSGGTKGVLQVSQQQGGATLASGQVTTGNTSTSIKGANLNRRRITLVNSGTADVWIGPTGVTRTTGLYLSSALSETIVLETTAAIFGISLAGTGVVTYLEEST